MGLSDLPWVISLMVMSFALGGWLEARSAGIELEQALKDLRKEYEDRLI